MTYSKLMVSSNEDEDAGLFLEDVCHDRTPQPFGRRTPQPFGRNVGCWNVACDKVVGTPQPFGGRDVACDEVVGTPQPFGRHVGRDMVVGTPQPFGRDAGRAEVVVEHRSHLVIVTLVVMKSLEPRLAVWS